MNDINMAILLLVTGLILSLNPFSISVFTSLLAGALDKAHNRHRIRFIAVSYLWFYWALISGIGALLVWPLSLLSEKNLQITALVASGLIIVLGMIILARYFWDKSHKQVPQILKKLVHSHSVKKSHPLNAMVLATLTSFVSLVGVGLQLLALAVIVALLKPSQPQWMLLPGLALIIPLKLIYLQILRGYKTTTILKWRDEAKTTMRLSLALMHIALGWIILLILNGSIS